MSFRYTADRTRGRPKLNTPRFYEAKVATERMHQVRQLVDTIVDRRDATQQLEGSARWQAWKLVREASGGRFDPLDDGMFAAVKAALASALSELPSKIVTPAIAARIPVWTSEGGEMEHPYEWVRESLRLRHLRRIGASQLAGDIALTTHDDSFSMEIWAEEDNEYQGAVSEFERERRLALERGNVFALRTAEAKFERVMHALDQGPRDVATRFPRVLAANEPL